jgi:hypothetical protein
MLLLQVLRLCDRFLELVNWKSFFYFPKYPGISGVFGMKPCVRFPTL